MQNEQRLLKFKWPEGISFYPEDFREKLAKSELLDNGFFNYSKAIEKNTYEMIENAGRKQRIKTGVIVKELPEAIPNNKPSMIKIIGARHWAGVLFQGEAIEHCYAYIEPIMKVANALAGQALSFTLEEHTLAIEPTTYPLPYRLDRMAIYRRSASARAANIESLVLDRVFGGMNGGAHGLDGMAQEFGLPPIDSALLDMQFILERNIGMHNKTSNGKSKEYCSLVSGQLIMNAKLSGIWHVGNLTARGFGALYHDYKKGVAA